MGGVQFFSPWCSCAAVVRRGRCACAARILVTCRRVPEKIFIHIWMQFKTKVQTNDIYLEKIIMNKKITEACVSYATFSYTQNGCEGGRGGISVKLMLQRFILYDH